MFSRAEIAGWAVAIVGICVMGFLALHGPFGHINVVHAVGGGKVNTNTNPDQVHVKILNDPQTIGKYVPSTVTARVGQSITFENDSAAPHSVTDQGGTFDLHTISEGDTQVLSIEKPGVYHYYCLYHPKMFGTIKIVPR